MIRKAEAQAEGIRKKILSGVRLDVKKQNLRTREELLSKIFEQVKEKIEAFRQTKAYKGYLKELVIEGVMAIDAERMRVLPGNVEKKLLSEATVKQIIGEIQKRTGRKMKLSVADQPLPEGGVVLISEDERMLFDNRFSARMQRMQSQMRLEAMKRVMG
jgi:vacuolar-type H+-ATPase subunit E/Vma4